MPLREDSPIFLFRAEQWFFLGSNSSTFSCRGGRGSGTDESRWEDEIVEDEGAVYEEAEPENLQSGEGPLQRFPSQAEGDEPDAESSARVDRASGGGADASRHTQPKEIEKAYTERDNDARGPDGAVVDHLMPSSREVEPNRPPTHGVKDGHGDDDREETEGSFEADGDEGADGVFGHDFLLDDELDGGEDLGEEDEEDSDEDSGGVGVVCPRQGVGECAWDGEVVVVGFLDEGTAEADERDADHDGDEGEPLVDEKPSTQEEDGKDANPEDKGPSGHLVY